MLVPELHKKRTNMTFAASKSSESLLECWQYFLPFLQHKAFRSFSIKDCSFSTHELLFDLRLGFLAFYPRIDPLSV